MTAALTHRAGAAAVDITPPLGTHLCGDIGRHRPAEWIRDPIYVRALVVEQDSRRVCVVSMDAAPGERADYDKVRQAAADRFGFDAEAVLVHSTQNHAGPGLGHYMIDPDSPYVPPEYRWLCGADEAFIPTLHERIGHAIELAIANIQPVKLGLAADADNRVAFNRRFIMRDGTSQMGLSSGGRDQVLQVEGPTDPEVGLAAFRDGDDQTVALLLHHTCHPTHGYPHLAVTADWPGQWVAGMQPSCRHGVPMVLNGCCGNIGPNNHLDPTDRPDQHRAGRYLTETATQVGLRLKFGDSRALSWISRKVRIPLRQLPDDQIHAARELLAKHPEPLPRKDNPPHTAFEWDWVYAVCTVALAKRYETQPYVDYEVQALRIGDLALVGLPGEPFVECQLKIKAASPAQRTYVAHYSNDFLGYVPTKLAIAGGGYETRTANWSKLHPDALDTIAAETIQVLKDLFA